MEFFKGFCSVISSDSLSLDIVEEMLGKVHLGEIPVPWGVFLFDLSSTIVRVKM